MLFRQAVLAAIARGEVDLAFRRWERPRVKAGSRLRTSVGVVEVVDVTAVDVANLGDDDARRAGYADVEALAAAADQRPGQLYRVALRLAGADPRLALRERGDLDADEIAELVARLARLDAASRHGPWTWHVLELIAASPGVRAGDLAPQFGRELRLFKADVRKLKELGLTESLDVGYRLSPRGVALLSSRRSV